MSRLTLTPSYNATRPRRPDREPRRRQASCARVGVATPIRPQGTDRELAHGVRDQTCGREMGRRVRVRRSVHRGGAGGGISRRRRRATSPFRNVVQLQGVRASRRRFRSLRVLLPPRCAVQEDAPAAPLCRTPASGRVRSAGARDGVPRSGAQPRPCAWCYQPPPMGRASIGVNRGGHVAGAAGYGGGAPQ
jgi:hypothetical protein